MNKKQEILYRLRESGDYVSGQELCENLGISRTAVWKNIQKLKNEGFLIEAVTNRGYRLVLPEDTDLFDRTQIQDRLTTAWAGRPLFFKEETGSTNDDIFRLAAEGYPHGTLVAAARQTAGKGRRGRTWISPQDGNIYMSILLKPDLPPDVTPMLTVVMALSAWQGAGDLMRSDPSIHMEALPAPVDPSIHMGTLPDPVDPSIHLGALPAPADPEAGPPAQPEAGYTEAGPSGPAPLVRLGIKWPNDLVISVDGGPYRKLCGILTEMRMEDNEISAITIGIGINVNQTEFAPEIAENATSFYLAAGRKLNRAALTAAIWNHFEHNYALFAQTRDFSLLRDAYEAALVNRGRAVHVLDPRSPFTGTAVGIDDRGALLVEPDDGGPARPISSGEVSVRGVKGYV